MCPCRASLGAAPGTCTYRGYCWVVSLVTQLSGLGFALCLCYCTCRRHRPCMSHFPPSCLGTGQVPLTVCCCTNTELTFPLLDKPNWVTFSLCRNSWFHLTVPAPPCTHRLSLQQVTEPAFPRKGHMQQESFITYLVIKETLENCHLIITCSAPP